MGIDVIEEGDKAKQGNAICPQCGEKVLIDKCFGDPPQCHKCNRPYETVYHPPDYH